MDEIQLALLGFCSASLSQSPATTSVPTPLVSSSLRSSLHPTEYALLTRALTLSPLYATLRDFAHDASIGRYQCFYAPSFANALTVILKEYEKAVEALPSAASLEVLHRTFAPSLERLARLAQRLDECNVAEYLRDVHQLVEEDRTLPLWVRQCVGETMWRGVLFVVAHLIANGALLPTRPGFFVIRPSSQHEDESDEDPQGYHRDEDGSAVAASSPPFELDPMLIPVALPRTVAEAIVQGGITRRTVLETVPKELQDSRAANPDTQRAQMMLRSLSHVDGLTNQGRLVVEELESRLDAANALWAETLWLRIERDSQVVEIVAAIRDMLLCHRGDVWATFGERALPILCQRSPRHRNRSSQVRGVTECFRAALVTTGLSDWPIFERFALGFDSNGVWGEGGHAEPSMGEGGGAAGGIDHVATIAFRCVRRLFMTVELPSGCDLIVSPQSVDQYHELFQVILPTKLALHALREVWSTVRDAGKQRQASEVAQLVKRLLWLQHQLAFVLGNVMQYLQVDLVLGKGQVVLDKIQAAKTAMEARTAHDQHVMQLSEGGFMLTPQSGANEWLESLWHCSFALYEVCARLEAAGWWRQSVAAAAVSSSSVPRSGDPFYEPAAAAATSTVPSPSPFAPFFEKPSARALLVEVQATLSWVEGRTQRVLKTTLGSVLHHPTRTALQGPETALWSYLDFGQYFSRQLFQQHSTSSSSSSGGNAPRSAAAAAAGRGVPLSLLGGARGGELPSAVVVATQSVLSRPKAAAASTMNREEY